MKSLFTTLANFFNAIIDMLVQEDPYMASFSTNKPVIFCERY